MCSISGGNPQIHVRRDSGNSISRRLFQRVIGSPHNPVPKTYRRRFFENIRQVESLIQMPLMMFAMLEIDEQISTQFRSLALDYWSRGEGFTNFLDEAKKIDVRPAKQPDFIERTLKRQDKVLTIPQCG